MLAVNVYPLLAVACGDDANGTLLVRRAAQHGISLELTTVHGSDPVPSADIYLLGGGGAAGAAHLADRLRQESAFADRVADGAVVLAVDAGLDALGQGITGATGHVAEGLGLLDVRTVRGQLRDGPVVSWPRPDLGLPALSGWEQHQARLQPGPGVQPFVRLEVGYGDQEGVDGVLCGRIIATRMHGPVLARNPEVADLVISWAANAEPGELHPPPPGSMEAAREQRLAEDRQAARRTSGTMGGLDHARDLLSRLAGRR